jgi:hypothetical protein
MVLSERRRELTVASPPRHPTHGRASPEALPKPRSLRELRLTSVELERASSGLTGVGNGRHATVLGRRAAIAAGELAPVTHTPTFTTLRCGLTRGVRGWPQFRQPAYRWRALPAFPSSFVSVSLPSGPRLSARDFPSARFRAEVGRPPQWPKGCGPFRFLGLVFFL